MNEQAALLALVAAGQRSRIEWHRVSALVEIVGSAARLVEARDTINDAFVEDELAFKAVAQVTDDDLEQATALRESMLERDIKLTTVLDADYPVNLRFIFNRPPFLFVRGSLLAQDSKAIAVVGTRKPSTEGEAQATELATELSKAGFTVLSGLAAGIDAAAHTAALNAGGRTVAVMGTGITNAIYPAKNKGLAERIVESGGALVSQFWPTAPPARWNFPMRNVVMSGMSIGTVVVEASHTSGARMQARLALEHGKRVFLVESLVLHEEWAKGYVDRPGVHVVENAVDVLKTAEPLLTARKPQQLKLV
jgi:DNA processing protein